MVAHLMPETPSEMQVMWYCMSSPCAGVFTPVFTNVSAVPVPYLTGEGPEDISNYNEESAWWAFKRIQLLIDEDYDERHAEAREVWDGLYNGSISDMDRIEGELRSLFLAGEVEEARRMMDSFVEGKLLEAYELALRMVEELSGAESGVEEEPSESLPEDDDERDGEVILYAGVFLFMAIVAGVLLLFVKRESGGLRA